MPGPPEISVIVPARDAAGTIGVALDALRVQRGPSCEVIVVDNGSLDDTAAIASAHPAVARVLRRARGEGPAAARNEGARAASGAVLAFTDADCAPAVDWLEQGLRAMSEADLVQGKVLPEALSSRGPFDRTVTVTAESGLFETANLFVGRSLFGRLGGFSDPSGGLAGSEHAPFGEDVWFGWRARRGGARVAFSDAAVVRHAVLRRTAAGFVSERARLRAFPALARQIPELRRHFFYRRVFLTRRSAAFDLALAGLVAGAVTGTAWPLLAAAPYAALVAAQARGWGMALGLKLAVAGLAADAVGFAALLRGSLRSRTLVL